jgi:hypothetical protein
MLLGRTPFELAAWARTGPLAKIIPAKTRLKIKKV